MEAIRRLPVHGVAPGTGWFRTIGTWARAAAATAWGELVTTSKAAQLSQQAHVKLRWF